MIEKFWYKWNLAKKVYNYKQFNKNYTFYIGYDINSDNHLFNPILIIIKNYIYSMLLKSLN